MKKNFAIIIIIFIVIMSMLTIILKAKEDDKKSLKTINLGYEQYLNKQVYGTDVTSIMYKAIDNNEKHKIQKDENGMYINDGKYCIKVELNMITIEKTYQMEQMYKAGITEFVKNFNVIEFECTSIEYHKETGRVSKIVFTQVEE